MKATILFLSFLLSTAAIAQEQIFIETDVTTSKFTDGTLTLPQSIENPTLVIFIQGSGPTDRNGNQMMAKNDGIKKISHQLAQNGIASYRYDKRIFKMQALGIQEKDLRFEHFVEDASQIVNYFKEQEKFKNIVIAGHSEGSLIGMLAASNIDGFISLAGPGKSIDKIIVDQLNKQSQELSENARQAFDEITLNKSTTNYSPFLESIFRPSVQPYIASWMKYDPAIEIEKLDIPVLIINGSNDLQVDTEDAELLAVAQPNAQLVILENMNHIFREIKGENLENSKAYNNSSLPLHEGLIPALVNFIDSIE